MIDKKSRTKTGVKMGTKTEVKMGFFYTEFSRMKMKTLIWKWKEKVSKRRGLQKDFLFFFLFFSLLSPLLQAEEGKQAKKRVSSITFEDELIQGEIQNPDLLYFSKESDSQYEKILPLRNDFLKEMRETGDQVPIKGR